MKNENSLHIYVFLKTPIATQYGSRSMIEIGNIRDLEISETKNYVLLPIKKDNENATAFVCRELDSEYLSWCLEDIKTEDLLKELKKRVDKNINNVKNVEMINNGYL